MASAAFFGRPVHYRQSVIRAHHILSQELNRLDRLEKVSNFRRDKGLDLFFLNGCL